MDVNCLTIIILVSATTMARRLARKERTQKPHVTLEPLTRPTTREPYFRSFPRPKMIAYKPTGFTISFSHPAWLRTNTCLLSASLNEQMNGTAGKINGVFRLDDKRLVWSYVNDTLRLRNRDRFFFVISMVNATLPREVCPYQFFCVIIKGTNLPKTEFAFIKSILREHIDQHKDNISAVADELLKRNLGEFLDKRMRARTLMERRFPPTPSESQMEWD